MDIFDGLHQQCADSIDVEKSDSSEDSDMEEGTIAFESNAAAESKRMFTYLPLVLVNVDGTPIEKQPKPIVIFKGEGNVFKHEKPLYHPDAQKTLQCSPLLSCLCPRWFLFLTRSVESPRRFLFLGWFLVWGQFLFLGQGFRTNCTSSFRSEMATGEPCGHRQ